MHIIENHSQIITSILLFKFYNLFYTYIYYFEYGIYYNRFLNSLSRALPPLGSKLIDYHNNNATLQSVFSPSAAATTDSPILAHWLSERLSHSLSARRFALVCVRRCAVFTAVCASLVPHELCVLVS